MAQFNTFAALPLYKALYYDTECKMKVFDTPAPLGPGYTDDDRVQYFVRYAKKYEKMVRRLGGEARLPRLPLAYTGRPTRFPQHSVAEPGQNDDDDDDDGV